jgi:hypothetical protein
VTFAPSSSWPAWLADGIKCLVRSLVWRFDDQSIPSAVRPSVQIETNTRISLDEPQIFRLCTFTFPVFLCCLPSSPSVSCSS